MNIIKIKHEYKSSDDFFKKKNSRKSWTKTLKELIYSCIKVIQ